MRNGRTSVTHVVNGETVSSELISIELADVPESHALDVGPAGETGQVFFQANQSAPFTPPVGSGVTLNPVGYTTITGMLINVNVPAGSFLIVTSYGDVANTDVGP